MPYKPLSDRELEEVIQRGEAELAEFDWFGSEMDRSQLEEPRRWKENRKRRKK